ncbi:alpha/beta hydrolase [Weissella confusa]|uniref:alpha/beta hydrolase n=1 Tax=Weissella confusa TaxID=1583 RepID=UPI0035A293ED
MKIQKDLRYGTDAMQQLDIYAPDNAIADIVLVHGGGWWQGDKRKEDELAGKLVAANFRVAAINYRLADGEKAENIFPTQREDAVMAVNWLVENAGFRLDKLVMWGASSGGNIALEAAQILDVPTVSWSGLNDLAGFMANHPNIVGKKLIIGADVKSKDIDQDGDNQAYYKWLVDNLTANGQVAYADATIYDRLTTATKPVFIANSMNELVPVGEVATLMNRLINLGVGVETMVLPGSRHGEGYMDDALPASIAFVTRVLELGD